MSDVPLPKYLELSGDLKTRIAAGEFRSGEQIPSEQALVSRYQVSRNTVRQAIALLEEENYLVRRRGAGTFVTRISEAGQPVSALDAVVLMIVDGATTPSGYNMIQIAAAERWAADREIAIASSNLMTMDLIQGRRPAILKQAICKAIVFDGWVTDMHCLVAEEMGVPYVIVGNHPVSPRLPQVRLDVETMMERMVAHLRACAGDQPIALMIEPLSLHISKEMLVAYTQCLRRFSKHGPLIEMVSDDDVREGVEHLIHMARGPFSLIATGRQLITIVDVYRRHGLDPREYPIVTVAHRQDVERLDRGYSALMPFDGASIMTEALIHFSQAYEQGRTEDIHLSLCPKAILPMEHQ